MVSREETADVVTLLQAAGLPRSTPRQNWPLPILRQLLAELVQETPHNLLARELWCGTGSASEWWSFQAAYTTSTAAMSMVGLSPYCISNKCPCHRFMIRMLFTCCIASDTQGFQLVT